MTYAYTAIAGDEVPRAVSLPFQHLLDTYASETNKVQSVWRSFTDEDLDWRPHSRSSSVREILRHQLLSERRFFGEFLQAPEPEASIVLPDKEDVRSYCVRLTSLARPRLVFLAERTEEWWHGNVSFFDVTRSRIWVFWRRVLHTAHHRTQLTVYLRLLDRPVPSSYGPTADVTWDGADPTTTVDAAARGA
ncbi:MAG: DinB family protein [Acidobacteria bacterium]|nr:DinB family protein [Acidobacteriota bacterium]